MENKQKRIRYRQRWYNVKCGCNGSDYFTYECSFQKTYNTSRVLKIFYVTCKKCHHYHWLIDTPITDPIYTKTSPGERYIKKDISRFEGVDDGSMCLSGDD